MTDDYDYPREFILKKPNAMEQMAADVAALADLVSRLADLTTCGDAVYRAAVPIRDRWSAK